MMIIGFGNARSGTNGLAKILGAAANASIHHEKDVYPWLNLEREGYTTNKTLLELGLKFPPNWVTDTNKNDCAKVCGDMSYYLSPFISRLYNADKRTNFIHILRHPADIITSHMNLGFPMSDELTNETHKFWETYRWRPFDASIKDRFTRLCLYWKATNEKMHQMEKEIPSDQLLILKMEDIQTRLEEIWVWCGLNYGIDTARELAKTHHNTRVPAISPPFPSYADWTQENKRTFEMIVGSSVAFKY